jgi:tRNA(Ile)-lysidine synthase
MIAQRWEKTDKLALALSGGIDSMVLYHLLRTVFKDTFDELLLLHVNHGVRDDSEKEEAYLRHMAEKDGFLLKVCHLNMSGHFTQNDARNARYQFFDREMKAFGGQFLLTAHHLNDYEETVIHQLLTGRYTHQFVGIRESVDCGDYCIIRPLLKQTKRDIKAYQRSHDVFYFEDSSNKESHYTRNYIRHHLMPDIYRSKELHEAHIIQLADDLNEYTEMAEKLARIFLDSHDYKLKKSELIKEAKLQQFYILKMWFEFHGVSIRRKAVKALIESLESSAPQIDFPVDGITVKVRYDDIFLSEDLPDDKLIEITEAGVFYFNGYKILLNDTSLIPLTVRTRKNGDRVYIENVGHKKVSRVFIDDKVTREERDIMPVIVDKNEGIVALGTIYNIMDRGSSPKGLEITKEFSYDAEK